MGAQAFQGVSWVCWFQPGGWETSWSRPKPLITQRDQTHLVYWQRVKASSYNLESPSHTNTSCSPCVLTEQQLVAALLEATEAWWPGGGLAVLAPPTLAHQPTHKLPGPGYGKAVLLASESPKRAFLSALFNLDPFPSAVVPALKLVSTENEWVGTT